MVNNLQKVKMVQEFFSGYLVPFTLAVTMLGMGLSLEKRDFRNVFMHPKALGFAILTKLILVPLIVFGLCYLTDLNPAYKVGLILIAACPGGATTNLLTYLLRGNLALSISMTAIASIIILGTLPVTVNIGLDVFMRTRTDIRLPFLGTILNIIFFTIIPTIIGIYIRAKNLKFAGSLEKPLRIILPVLLIAVFSWVFITEQNQEGASINETLTILPVGLLLNFFGMVTGYLVAWLIKLSNRNRFTIAIEVGLQNTALAIFIASTILNNSSIALVAVVYASFSFFSTALFGYLMKRIRRNIDF